MDSLAECYAKVRSESRAIAAPLTPEDCAAQSMLDASPIKWHLAHTTWFFETFLLEPNETDYRTYRDEFRVLFNSYYHSVGEQHPRPERGLLTRPSLEEVIAYRDYVDWAVASLCARGDTPAVRAVLQLGIEHERQHQELMLTDLKHLLYQNPLRPAYSEPTTTLSGVDKPLSWHEFEAGLVEIGVNAGDFSFDNERPRHRIWLESFKLATRLVTNADYLGFMADDGYSRPDLWLADGWAWVQSQEKRAPLYWDESDAGWVRFTLGGMADLGLHEPVSHVSYYEADAYARWAAARLPTEAEWESVAARVPVAGNFYRGGIPRPQAPTAEASDFPEQLFGDLWEWTSSGYAPYPGFSPMAGAFGEYNGKFMANQLVLRGGSCATTQEHIRTSYRNFFYPDAQWQFSGIRLARDA